MEIAMQKRIVILGIGNILNSDEGVGVQALEALQKELPDLAGVEFLDGGTLGLNLLDMIEECSHLLVLDAANAGKAPGTLIQLTRDQIPLFSGVKMSQHQATFQEVLGLANVRGNLPERLHFIGVQPDNLEIGLNLSETVQAKVPSVVEAGKNVLREWNLLPEESEAIQCGVSDVSCSSR
jgi:hydrogenase maturation protease